MAATRGSLLDEVKLDSPDSKHEALLGESKHDLD